jgi:hypothetical protein
VSARGQSSDEVRSVLAESLLLIGWTLSARPAEQRLEMVRRALAILRELAEKSPSVTRYLEKQAGCHEVIGIIPNLSMGKPAEAVGAYEEAFAVDQTSDTRGVGGQPRSNRTGLVRLQGSYGGLVWSLVEGRSFKLLPHG